MIRVHEPLIGEREATLVAEALKEGQISGSAGRFIDEFERKFADYCECQFGIAVSNGSTALHLAMVVVGIQPGDEVLVSACTNIASGNAVVMEGGIVVPIDSEPDTWNLDPSLLESAITTRTKAIMPVHIYGHPVDMDPVLRLAREHGLRVVEDCAEAHGALYRGKKAGSLGDLACFSFYANKVITTGEGGMITTNDPELADKARRLRNLAFGKPRFVHHEVGFNYRMTNLQAAMGVAQLERIEAIVETKRTIARKYTERLAGARGLRLPVEKDYARNIYWMYAVVVDPEFGMSRDQLAEALLEHGIETRTFFCPLNLQPAYLQRRVVRPLPCPEAVRLWERGLYLPSGCLLTDDQITHVSQTIRSLGR
jgi:perosamine synthetase